MDMALRIIRDNTTFNSAAVFKSAIPSNRHVAPKGSMLAAAEAAYAPKPRAATSPANLSHSQTEPCEPITGNCFQFGSQHTAAISLNSRLSFVHDLPPSSLR